MDDLQDIENMELSSVVHLSDQFDRIKYMVKGIKLLTDQFDSTDDWPDKNSFDWCRKIIQNHLNMSLEALSSKCREEK